MSSLPAALLDALRAALAQSGDPGAITGVQPLGGGCINQACRLETSRRAYLLKWNARPLPGMYPHEAEGLDLLRSVGAIRVPEVVTLSEAAGGTPAFLVLEWIESAADRRAPRQDLLGNQLARLHSAGQPPQAGQYGLDRDNYIGSTPQQNDWNSDWVAFFREQRLRPQIELAQARGRLPAARRERLERVLERLDDFLGGVNRRPALLHGDLWGGNVMAGAHGEPVLIDPAVYYGDREAELAFTELFGGFSPAFYHAYRSAWPLESGYKDRRDLYNLYHLLNHLNLFGESYGGEVEEVAKRYC